MTTRECGHVTRSDIQALRDAGVALRREWEDPPVHGRWSDAAVWFGSLLMLGPARTRGVGMFASVVLISRTWAAAHRRHTRHVNDAVGAMVIVLADDLEDRAAVDDAFAVSSSLTNLADSQTRGVTALSEAINAHTDQIAELRAPAATTEVTADVDLAYLTPSQVGVLNALVTHAIESLTNSNLPVSDDERSIARLVGQWALTAERRRVEVTEPLLAPSGGQFYIVRDVDQAERHAAFADWPDGFEVVAAHCSARSTVARNVQDLRALVAAALHASPVGEVGIRPVQGPLLRPEAEDPDGVVLTLAEAQALRNFVHGDHFDTADIDTAVAKIDAYAERVEGTPE
jgi:hypothetical protein